MQSVALDKTKHDRNRFDCGVAPLNHYLQLMAGQQAKKDNSRTFVLQPLTCAAVVLPVVSVNKKTKR